MPDIPVSYALSPSPSPGTGEGSIGSTNIRHVFKGVEGRKYPPKPIIENARAMRKLPTEAEKKLWEVLRRHKLDGLYFRRQRPVGIFILDFYCEERRLAIEVDGGVHADSQQRRYDKFRTEFLAERGIRILRFRNKDVLEDLDWVLAEINKQALSLGPSPVPGEGSNR
jgi:type I restriction enzyme M protein